MVELAELQHGVVARVQLLGRGVSPSAIDRRVGRGQLHVLHRGVYAVGHRVLSQQAHWLAAVLACGAGSVLSHRSAGQLWQIVSSTSVAPEVTRRGHHRGRPGIRAHRSSLAEDEIEVVDRIPVTCVARTVFDLAGSSRPRELERAWSEMEVRRLTSRVSVPQLLERYPGRPGAAALRALLGSKEPGGVTRNDFEEDFVALLEAHGLPRPRLNADLWLRGRFIEVDCLWPRERLAVELDGRAVHAREAAFESDKWRDRELLAEGWRTARVTWRQLREEPDAVVADLRDALGGA